MKIALIGSAPSSVNLAPVKDAKYNAWLGGKPAPQSPPSEFIDDDWQIWGCSPGAWAQLPRSDRWFEVHRFEPGQLWFSPEYVQFLQNYRGPVYTGGPIPEIPNHVVYPIERVEEEFSAYFLHSSLSLMLAVAILEIMDARAARQQSDEGAAPPEDDTIGMWGVDMAATEEYGDQKDGCHFFILEALRRGIKFYVPPESCLLRPKPIYGLSEWSHDYIKCTARTRELNGRRQAIQQQLAELTKQDAHIAGALDDMTYFINTWISPYGLPSGTVVGQDPGTGLGGGVTLNRPMTAGANGYVPPGAINHLDEDATLDASLNDPHVTLGSTDSGDFIPPKPPKQRTRPKPKAKRGR